MTSSIHRTILGSWCWWRRSYISARVVDLSSRGRQNFIVIDLGFKDFRTRGMFGRSKQSRTSSPHAPMTGPIRSCTHVFILRISIEHTGDHGRTEYPAKQLKSDAGFSNSQIQIHSFNTRPITSFLKKRPVRCIPEPAYTFLLSSSRTMTQKPPSKDWAAAEEDNIKVTRRQIDGWIPWTICNDLLLHTANYTKPKNKYLQHQPICLFTRHSLQRCEFAFVVRMTSYLVVDITWLLNDETAVGSNKMNLNNNEHPVETCQSCRFKLKP